MRPVHNPGMDRLAQELKRLYGLETARDADAAEAELVDADGRVRAMVLALAGPPDWAALARVWQGVQRDLDLPAPAIAISGTDAYQLWFSLAQPVSVARARAFLDGLRLRYLGDIEAARISALPAFDGASPPSARHARHARPVPSRQAGGEQWSAFVAQDLAPVFAEQPWLDMPPNAEGQARLLAGLECMQAADLERALQGLQPASTAAEPTEVNAAAAPAGGCRDPQRFLIDVMNDESVDLALRIEAAKALLAHAGDGGRVAARPV